MPRGSHDYERNNLLLVQGLAEEGKTTTIMQLVNGVCEATGTPWELYLVDLDQNLLPGWFEWGTDKLLPVEARERVWHVRVAEQTMLSEHGLLKPVGRALGWPRMVDLTKRWGERDAAGKLVEADPYAVWPENRVVVIDGLTVAAELAFLHAKANQAGGRRTDTGELLNWDVGDYRVVPDLLYSYLIRWKYMENRKFPVIFTCHVDHLRVNLQKTLTDDEISDAMESKSKKADITKKAGQVQTAMSSVDTARMFPELPGRSMPKQMKRLFYSVWIERAAITGEPFIYTTPTERYSCRMPPGLPRKLSGKDGMSKVLNHLQQVGREEASVSNGKEETTE